MWGGLLDLIFPPRCLLCPTPGPRFCGPCEAALFGDPLGACPGCAAVVGPFAGCAACAATAFGFDGAVRLGVYDGPLREAVLRLKSADGESLAETLGHAWAERRRPAFAGMNATSVVPVPLHWMRRLRRGYNQAEAVARGLAAGLGLPLRTRRLWRVRATTDQKSLGRAQRLENLRGAFTASAVAGERVLLIDDVMTTGATCGESARALKKAGAAAVHVAVLARASDGAGGG
ncbi:MAG: ComF family protein [Gemmataceae bacterium]